MHKQIESNTKHTHTQTQLVDFATTGIGVTRGKELRLGMINSKKRAMSEKIAEKRRQGKNVGSKLINKFTDIQKLS